MNAESSGGDNGVLFSVDANATVECLPREVLWIAHFIFPAILEQPAVVAANASPVLAVWESRWRAVVPRADDSILQDKYRPYLAAGTICPTFDGVGDAHVVLVILDFFLSVCGHDDTSE